MAQDFAVEAGSLAGECGDVCHAARAHQRRGSDEPERDPGSDFMRRWTRAAAVLGSVAGFATPALAQEPASLVSSADAQEQIARREIQGLREVARNLKRLSREMKKSDQSGDRTAAYLKWLDSAVLRVDSLAKRWASNLDYFYRDFPREALLADPERLAYAFNWLSELNVELAAEAVELRRNLETRNETFASGVSNSHLAAARSIVSGMAE